LLKNAHETTAAVPEIETKDDDENIQVHKHVAANENANLDEAEADEVFHVC
jgi:hypothetical protein